MSEWYLIKGQGGFHPGDPTTEELATKVRLGGAIHGKFTQARNPRFHRKFFAMLNMAFDYWQPGEINSEHGTPEKNFDRFRKDALILAGFYHVVIRLDGSTRIEADSISFASMDDDKFSDVYNGVLNVFLRRIPEMAKLGAEEINGIVDQLIAFG